MKHKKSKIIAVVLCLMIVILTVLRLLIDSITLAATIITIIWMIFKSFFLIISIFLGIFGIVMINRLPMEKYSLEENYRKISRYTSIGCAYDIIMFVVVAFIIIPPGEYGTGIEIFITMVVILFYAPPCFIASFRLKKRMKQLHASQHNVSWENKLNYNFLGRINSLRYSIFFKALFFLVGIIWVVEV